MSEKKNKPQVIQPAKAVNNLALKLQNKEKRKIVEEILESYKNLDKITLMNRDGILIHDLEPILGKGESVALANVINSVGEQIDPLIDVCVDKENKDIIIEIHAKFGPVFAGFRGNMPRDWVRVAWRTSIDAETSEPIVALTVFRRDGEHFEIESPLQAWIQLFNFTLRQFIPIMKKVETAEAEPAFLKTLSQVQKNLQIIADVFKSDKQVE